MFIHIASFEIRYWLRSWMLWIFVAILTTLILMNAGLGDALAVDNSYTNAPYNIESIYTWMGLVTLLMTTAFVNSAAAREFASGFWQILFATPLRKFDFLAGRYVGSTLIAVIPLLGVSLALLAAPFMPWAKAEQFGPVHWSAHLNGILIFGIPNTIFIGSLMFAIAALTRSTLTSFLGALGLLSAYTLARGLASNLDYVTAAGLLDPFGIRTFEIATRYWTAVDKNQLSLGFAGLILWNRLIWLSAAALIFALTYSRFRFEERRTASSKVVPEDPAITPQATLPVLRPSSGFAAQWAQFLGSLRMEFRWLVKSTTFIVIVVAQFLALALNIFFSTRAGVGNATLPVTYDVLGLLSLQQLFLLVLVAHYSGVLVWKDRDHGMDEIRDASPRAVWPDYAAKVGALTGAILLLLLAGAATGTMYQISQHYYRFQFGLYAFDMAAVWLPYLLFQVILAFFIQVISPNKYLGYFIYVAYQIVDTFLWPELKIYSLMIQFGRTPNYTYSDFYGFAPFLLGHTWFNVYWATFCVLLALLTILLWQRGRERGWRPRSRECRLRFTPRFRAIVAGSTIVWLAVAAWVFYNTKVLNHIVTDDQVNTYRADYEKQYKRYQSLTMPTLKNVRYEADLIPENREFTIRGDQTLTNETTGPIPEIHLSIIRDDAARTEIEVDGGSLRLNDARLGYRIYRLASPLLPGASLHIRSRVHLEKPGFENQAGNLAVLQNGTFQRDVRLPGLGYQIGAEIVDADLRKKQGLPPKEPLPALVRNCLEQCTENGAWVSAEAIVSTALDQIAVSPGSLVREWNQNGRRYFHYKLDHDSIGYSFVSGRFEVAREKWKGVDLEVYYHKDHSWNVPKMLRSMRKSLEYFTSNFGSYPHQQARIVEFPRVINLAMAFPGTMPYSEGIGFIADLRPPDAVDSVYFTVAHEMAHQWWGLQITGAHMQGAQMLSESLADYSALIVMEKEYGRDAMRKFLEYRMNSYLQGRSGELNKESALARVEGQPYIYYQKGGIVLYYLKEMIGEEAVNRALRKVLRQYAYNGRPYPTSYALLDALEAETPESMRYLIKDLFEDITLFDNRAFSATARKRVDGKYDLTIDVQSRKFKADGKGNQTEVPVQDWIELGAFAKPAPGRRYGATLLRERVFMTQPRGVYKFVVKELPDQAGIDPLLLMIDRIPDDNLKPVVVE